MVLVSPTGICSYKDKYYKPGDSFRRGCDKCFCHDLGSYCLTWVDYSLHTNHSHTNWFPLYIAMRMAGCRRGNSDLVVISILRDLIAVGQLWVHQFTPGINTRLNIHLKWPLAIGSHFSALHANKHMHHWVKWTQRFLHNVRKSWCLTFAELTRRPKWLRPSCRQCFTKLIKSLMTPQLTKLHNF